MSSKFTGWARAIIAVCLSAGMLAGAGPSWARPPYPLAPVCTNWLFNGFTQLTRSDGWVMWFISDNAGVPETARFNKPLPDGGFSNGPLVGGIQGTAMNIREQVTGDPVWTLWAGNIDQAGNASGIIENSSTSGVTWHTNAPLRCQSAPPSLQGPTVSWDYWPGGVTAHITDRSGIDAQCTYTADWYDRSFFLPANSTSDLVIWPAIPEHRNWHITIACDNGTRTETTTFF
jgi:hypothetical protein